MTLSIRTIGAVVLGSLFVMPAMTLAQETGAVPIPVVDVSGGYTLLRDLDNDTNFPMGWYFAGGVNVTRWFGLVGEVTGSYRTVDLSEFSAPYDGKLRHHAVMGGPRFFFQKNRIVPFGQLLVGTAFVQFTYPDMTFAMNRQLALQPGGGATFYLNEQVGLRVAVDYRYLIDEVADDPEDQHAFRALAGITFGWGAR